MIHPRNLKSKAMTPMRALGGGMDGRMVHDLLHIWSKSIVDNYAQDHETFKRKLLDKQRYDIGKFGNRSKYWFCQRRFWIEASYDAFTR